MEQVDIRTQKDKEFVKTVYQEHINRNQVNLIAFLAQLAILIQMMVHHHVIVVQEVHIKIKLDKNHVVFAQRILILIQIKNSCGREGFAAWVTLRSEGFLRADGAGNRAGGQRSAQGGGGSTGGPR